MAKGRKPKRKEQKSKEADKITEIPGQVSLERSPFKLKGRIRYLSTNIDELYNYILEKKTVKLAEAARKFHVTKKVAEDWGLILEDHRMIEMHYPVAGDPVMRVPGFHGHKRKKDKKPKKKPGMPKMPKLTRKRIFIMAEIIVLGELLIYIFLVNPRLRENFIPTLNYHITNLPANIANIPNYVARLNLPVNPLYVVIGIIIVLFWIFIAIIRKKNLSHAKGERRKKQE